ncbi:MAG: hypothetical protein KAI64_02500, partial [Thermoplasmata archaeon]|nr:hypothetical protein [Thermoplasmata archaeon]
MTLPIIILLTPILFLSVTHVADSGAEAYSLEKVPFPSGTYVIPMDEKQVDVLKAYGFAHALLRNETTLYRIIQPPDAFMTTQIFDHDAFKGGPILIWKEFRPVVELVKESFPTVTLDTLREVFVSTNVLAIEEPTDILIVKGNYNWGMTEVLLDDMAIPYGIIGHRDLESNRTVMFDYNLVVDDCPGWWHDNISDGMVADFRSFVSDGGNAIFTDISILDAKKIFPGYFSTKVSVTGTMKSRIYELGTPMSQ